jgi:hypothetical protein
MYSRDDLEQLVRAARRAVDTIRVEHDLWGPGAQLDACRVEAEALAFALEPFEEVR